MSGVFFSQNNLVEFAKITMTKSLKRAYMQLCSLILLIGNHEWSYKYYKPTGIYSLPSPFFCLLFSRLETWCLAQKFPLF